LKGDTIAGSVQPSRNIAKRNGFHVVRTVPSAVLSGWSGLLLLLSSSVVGVEFSLDCLLDVRRIATIVPTTVFLVWKG
jgi:hypothetical protein